MEWKNGFLRKWKTVMEYLNAASGRLVSILFYSCLSIAVLTVIRVFFLASFKIPSDSMQPSLLPGDRILVDKCSGGARLFNVLDALDHREVDIRRMPGWRDFRRNDVLVFNFPYQPQRWDSIVFDVMRYYVKRCVAVPGDTLEIRGGYYRISGHEGAVGYLPAQKFIACLPDSGATGMVMNTFPWNERLGWTVKEFGPLPVPARGQVVRMDSLSWLLYRQPVGWEQKRRLRIDSMGNVSLGDSVIREYRFRENYYFVAGDKAENSQDSRYWGLLPESFIVGRTWRIWKSVEPESGKTRWNRIWRRVE